jgi:ABC-type branched-subunit amino acid transport system permease subunit
MLAAVSAIVIMVAAKGFIYKGGEPNDLLVWAIATVAGCLVGTSVAPPSHRKSARYLCIAMAVFGSVILVLRSFVEHTFTATDVYAVLGSVIGGVIAWAIINPP